MRLLKGLSRFLLEKTCLERENIHAWADDGDLIPSGKALGNDGYEICRFKYDGNIELESCPVSSTVIIALVAGWLNDNDKDREHLELGNPEITAELNDDRTADVTITVLFNESIQIVADENGPIHSWGKRWRVADVPIDTATELLNMEGGSGGTA